MFFFRFMFVGLFAKFVLEEIEKWRSGALS